MLLDIGKIKSTKKIKTELQKANGSRFVMRPPKEKLDEKMVRNFIKK